MRRLVYVAIALGFLVVTATAAAYVTPPADRSGVHSLLTCLYPYPNPPTGVLGGTGDSKGSISSTTDLYLTIAWGSVNAAQDTNFLTDEYGSIVISRYDETTKAIGPQVDMISWGNKSLHKQTDFNLWTAPTLVSVPGGGSQALYQTRLFAHVGPLGSGTYWVQPDIEITKTLYDGGPQPIPSGTWYAHGCEMVVG